MTSIFKRPFILVPVLVILLAVVCYHLFPGAVVVVLRNMERGSAGLKQRGLDARIQIMKDVGHLPMLEKPEVSAQALLAFLNI